MKTALGTLLPLGVSFNLTVFDKTGNAVNSEVIQNSNLLGREVVSVQYVCVARRQVVDFFAIRLQLAWTG